MTHKNIKYNFSLELRSIVTVYHAQIVSVVYIIYMRSYIVVSVVNCFTIIFPFVIMTARCHHETPTEGKVEPAKQV